jgi:hypothetical protein
LTCRNKNFNLDSIARTAIENVAQDIIRSTFSLAKLSYIEKTGAVIYRSKMSHGVKIHYVAVVW